jgi:hypothetical protein
MSAGEGKVKAEIHRTKLDNINHVFSDLKSRKHRWSDDVRISSAASVITSRKRLRGGSFLTSMRQSTK